MLALSLCWFGLAVAAGPSLAADPGRWAESGASTIPLYYYQGVTSDPQVNLYFDGIHLGLYRTDSRLNETARNDDVIPVDVKLREQYNHIGDITWDAAEGGRILLPLECYYPVPTPVSTPVPAPDHDANTCKTGSIGVADPQTLRWRYYVKLDPSEITKAMWAEVSPDGALLWTSSGRNLLAYSVADIVAANAAPTGPPIKSVRRLIGAVPPVGISGASFGPDGRLFTAGQDDRTFRIHSIDLANGRNQLEIERQIIGESEGIDFFSALGGVLHWQIQPYNEESIPTYGVTNGTLLHFVPLAPDVKDGDADGISDARDNCPAVANADQANADGDARGDLCDPDDDNDDQLDASDNCRTTHNPGQENSDDDPDGDACDPDDDNDGVLDGSDSCPEKPAGTEDGCPAASPPEQPDQDNDGVTDLSDNCPAKANADQANADEDAQGDVCDPDDDNDGVTDLSDNCPTLANQGQVNRDADPDGDACDPDDDNDGVADGSDNCRTVANSSQANSDSDPAGDACDPDDDNDGRTDGTDNCRVTPNPGRTDADGDGRGDPCDPDDDNDGRLDGGDNCPRRANPGQADADRGGRGDACDPDDDNDGLTDAVERSRGTSPFDRDSDDDGPPDGREDGDRDGRLDPRETDPSRPDTDGDGLPDGLERGVTQPVADPPGPVRGSDPSRFRPDADPGSRTNPRSADTDHDGLADGQEDRDRDGRRDRGETDPADRDTDGDGFSDKRDRRPLVPAP